MMFALGLYAGITYAAGFKFFGMSNPSLGSTVAFIFSPVTVPAGLAILAIVY